MVKHYFVFYILVVERKKRFHWNATFTNGIISSLIFLPPRHTDTLTHAHMYVYTHRHTHMYRHRYTETHTCT